MPSHDAQRPGHGHAALPAQGPPPPSVSSVTDARTIALIEQSWTQLAPIADAAATLFYDRLFELAPQVRPLFKSDLSEQKRKFMQTVGVAVRGLRDPGKLIPALEQLGRRHRGYMVEPAHYEVAGQALLWALREGLGDEQFTPELRSAWQRVYTMLATVMIEAADGARPNQRDPTEISDEATHVSTPERPRMTAAPSVSPAQAARPPHPSGQAPRVGPPASPRAAIGGDGRAEVDTPDEDAGIDRHTIDLVQRSWTRVHPISDAAATLFYNRLFELDPSVQALFKSDLREQKRKLMQTLSTAVTGLRDPDKLVPILADLGRRHVGYMVKPEHYGLVGESLIWTLQEGLGSDFTPELEAAWRRVYGFVAKTMLDAASQQPRAPHPVPALAPPPAPSSARVSAGAPAAAPASAPAAPAPAASAPAPDTAHRAPERHIAAAAPAAHAAAPGHQVLHIAPSSGGEPIALRLTLDDRRGREHAALAKSVGVAAALLLAVTCGLLVSAAATSLLIGLQTSAPVTGLGPALLFALPLLVTLATALVFGVGFVVGRRRGREQASPTSRAD